MEHLPGAPWGHVLVSLSFLAGAAGLNAEPAAPAPTPAPLAARQLAAAPRVFSPKELSAVKQADLRDTDMVELRGRKYTLAELKARAAQDHAKAQQLAMKLDAMEQEQLQHLRADGAVRNQARVSALRAEIARLVQKVPNVPTVGDQPGSGIYCDHPQIFSVYPAEVRPNDPFVIQGCGFLGQGGQALIVFKGEERILGVGSWTATTIHATIPDITGFPYATQVTAAVRTSSGAISAVSSPVTLTPLLTYDTLHGPPGAVHVGGSVCALDSGGYSKRQSFSAEGTHTGIICCWPCECHSKDRYFDGFGTLKNGWKVTAVGLNKTCVMLGEFEFTCHQDGDAYAGLTVSNPTVGSNYVQQSEIYWHVSTAASVSYRLFIPIEGPVGTSPY